MSQSPPDHETRKVEEWIGRTPDTPVPARVKLRVFRRYGGRCYLSGRKIMPGDKWDVEHVLAIVNGGKNRETNLAPALKAPHKAKSAADMATKSKTERMAKKHLGIWPKGRGFGPRSRKFDGTVSPTRRALREANDQP